MSLTVVAIAARANFSGTMPGIIILRYFPLQPAGLLLLALALGVGFVFAPSAVDAVAYAAAVTTLVVIAVCFVSTAVATLWLRRKLRAARGEWVEQFETGVQARTGFVVPRWPIVQVRVTWDAPVRVALLPGGEEVITPYERGRLSRVSRQVRVWDAFGITGFTFRLEHALEVRIAPGNAGTGAGLAMSYGSGGDWSQPGGPPEGDLVEMRQYGPGDPMRRVLWKTFARSRRLLVRQPEPAISPRPVNVGFFIAGAADEATAAVARAYLERGLLGSDFLFAADGAFTPARTVVDAIDQIIDSTRSRNNSGVCLATMASKIDPARMSAYVVFAPARPGRWVELLRGLPASSTVVIGSETDISPRGERTPLEKVLLKAEDDGTAAATAELRALLRNAGIRVHVVHRETGRVL